VDFTAWTTPGRQTRHAAAQNSALKFFACSPARVLSRDELLGGSGAIRTTPPPAGHNHPLRRIQTRARLRQPRANTQPRRGISFVPSHPNGGVNA
jgi:hypothetical protein